MVNIYMSQKLCLWCLLSTWKGVHHLIQVVAGHISLEGLIQDGSPQSQCMDLYYTPHLCHHLGMHLCVLIVPIRYEYLNDLINNRNIHSSSNNKYNQTSTTQLAGTNMQLQNKFSLQPHSFCLLGPWVNRGNNPVQCQKLGHWLDMIYSCIQVSGN